MAPRTADEIRSAFLSFFHERGHAIVKSSSLVPQNDPTLLFTNSGMVQFKDVFTGKEKREYTRATTSQKSVRAGGKHNDLENVGFTARHHTFFEMLGNFSFGDYFKTDAIKWGWELVTKVLELPPERLAVTIFKGDDKTPADEEASRLWLEQGVRPERLFRLGEDNFWQMGPTGPCGPCTEIHIYRGDLKSQAEIDAHAKRFFGGQVDNSDDWMEIWNLVFMQFERSADDSLKPLPKQSVDTGAGLERLASAVQGVPTNYDTDLLHGLCVMIADLAKKAYPSTKDDTASVRVIADHSRATAFLIADGVMPSNEGRGYVLRRIMRRAIRHGKRLGMEELFFDRVCQKVVDLMGAAYPELRESAAFIREVVRNEEESFRRTLNRGLQMLDEELATLRQTGGKVIPGTSVFKLYDTYGFPTDLTRVIAAENSVDIDEKGFEAEMEEQRRRSQDFGGSGEKAIGDLYKVIASEVPPTRFLGYRELKAPGKVLRIIQDGKVVRGAKAPARVEIVLDQTPFYGESGGQLGDKGSFDSPQGVRGTISDVQRPVQGFFVHKADLTAGTVDVGDTLNLEIDNTRRLALRANHSATHLLHLALRETLGDHVKQKGSVVAPDYLRFDYAHFAALAPEQIQIIERRVNQLVRDNYAANTDELPIEEAKKRGAIAFFDEKYGETVRVLSIGPSMELCGGTHVSRSGDVGFFKIKEESAIAAGIRRIVAVTGPEAVALVQDEESALSRSAQLLKTSPLELPLRVEAAQLRIRDLEKELDSFKKAAAAAKSGDLAAQAREIKGVKVIASRSPDGDPKGLRDLADKLRDKLGRGVVALGVESDGKAQLLVAVTKDLTDKLPAKSLLEELNKELGGRGGGKPDMAQSGGGDASKLDAALSALYALVESRL